MDIVEQIFKTLNPQSEEPKAEIKTDYVSKEELENVVAKVTENIESKFTAMFEKFNSQNKGESSPSKKEEDKTEEEKGENQ